MSKGTKVLVLLLCAWWSSIGVIHCAPATPTIEKATSETTSHVEHSVEKYTEAPTPESVASEHQESTSEIIQDASVVDARSPDNNEVHSEPVTPQESPKEAASLEPQVEPLLPDSQAPETSTPPEATGPGEQGTPDATGPTSPNPKLAALKANQILDLKGTKFATPVGEPANYADRSVTDYSGMVYDPHHHRILLFGGGHSATFSDAIYAFSFQTLSWKELYTPTPSKFYKKSNMVKGFWQKGGSGPYPRPVGRHTYDLLVVPSHRKELLMLRNGGGPSFVAPGIGYFGGAAGVYDFTTKKWTPITVPFGGYGNVAEYDPPSKKVIAIKSGRIFVFDPDTRKSTELFSVSGLSYSNTLVYYPPNQKMYYIRRGTKDVWELTLDRKNWKQSKMVKITVTGQHSKHGEPGYAYDDKNKLIGGGVHNSVFYALDPVKKVWLSQTISNGKPGNMAFHTIAYSPKDNVYIFIAKLKSWAYRWK